MIDNGEHDKLVADALKDIWGVVPDTARLGLAYHMDRMDAVSYGYVIPVTARNLDGVSPRDLQRVLDDVQGRLDNLLSQGGESTDEYHLILDLFDEAA